MPLLDRSVRRAAPLLRWLVAGVCGCAALAVAIGLTAEHWPFRRATVVRALESALSSKVLVTRVHYMFFPHPGCVMDGVDIGPGGRTGETKPITIRQLIIRGSYSDFFTRGRQIDLIRVSGMQIRVSLKDAHAQTGFPRLTSASVGAQMSIRQLIMEGAVIELTPAGRDKPLRFDISNVALHPVAAGHPISFTVTLRSPVPPGVIKCAGVLGPWKWDAAGQTPLKGSFTFDHANLATFHGIAGILSSRGSFGGILQQINIVGSTDTPDFEVTRSAHTVHLKTQFQSVVNGINGDITLNAVKAQFEKTSILAEGDLAGSVGKEGKTASIRMTVHDGRIQDLLRLFLKPERQPMTGSITFQATATLPPERRPFLQKILLDGNFGIEASRFTNPRIQAHINELSERAEGEKQNDPENVTSDLHGRVRLKEGVATFSNLFFNVPGASAEMKGTYSLISERVNLSGALRMKATASQASTGVKSLFLKLVDPLFKRKNAGAVLPVRLTGTYSHPSFGVSLTHP